MAKVNITLDDELLKRVDEFADSNYMSRSGLVTASLSQYLNQAEVSKAICDIAVSMRKIADTGKIDHEAKEQLEDFERLAKMFVGK